MNDDSIQDDQYPKELKEQESLHLGAMFLEENKGQVEYEPEEKPLFYDQNEILAPMMAQPMVFPPEYNGGAINASRTTEFRPTEIAFPQIVQVKERDQKVIDFEESK